MPLPAAALAAAGADSAAVAGATARATATTYSAAAPAGVSRAAAAAVSVGRATGTSFRAGGASGTTQAVDKTRSVHDLWAWHSLLSQAGAQADGWFPRFQHSIAVTVVGGPRSTLKSIWQLALATVFGRYRQSAQVGTQTGSIECTWDITGKVVGVKLYYENNGLVELVQRGTQVTAGARKGTGGIGQFLATGPSGETVGGPFVSWLDGSPVSYNASANPPPTSATTYTGGAPTPATSSTARATISKLEGDLKYGFVLPDDGRIITTEFKDSPDVQPLAPEFDHLSRTIPYIALVANALTDPGYLPASPPKNGQKKVRRGKRLYSPGKAPGASLQNKKFTVPNLFPVETDFLASLERKYTTLDGYPLLQQDDVPPDVQGEVNSGL